MAGRSFRFSSVLAVIAATGFGCAEGASETGTGDGVDSGGTEQDSTAADSGAADTGPKDTGTSDTGSGDGSGCDPGKGLTISCGVGECTVTMPACSETGTPNTCKPKDPGVEVCNGKDDDCDGVVDEDLGETECGKGECTVKQKNCVDGSPKTCMPKAPSMEICDGKDNDCDGAIDNGFPTSTCGVGECKVTVSACSGGMVGMCTPKMPGTEICNGKDDDCDGVNDNGIAAVMCGSGVCANTAPGCIGGIPGVCIPKDLGIESCGVGECVNFVSKCVGGVPQTCMPKPKGIETCNGKDDDCDGTEDNGDPAIMCPPGAKVVTTECASTKCKVKTCLAGFADADGDAANGCECTDSTTPHACPGAPFGTVAIGTERTFSSNNPVAGRDDWLQITFIDARSNKLANPRIKLTMPAGWTGPIPFEFEVQQNGCGGARPACAVEGGTALGVTEWKTSWGAFATGTYGQPLFQPILLGSTQNATVYVRVSYKTGATTTCAPYTLTIGN